MSRKRNLIAVGRGNLKQCLISVGKELNYGKLRSKCKGGLWNLLGIGCINFRSGLRKDKEIFSHDSVAIDP